MARAKLQAPDALVPSLGNTLPAVIEQEAEHNRQRAEMIQRVDSAFGFDDEYNRDRELAALAIDLEESAIKYALAGARFLRIKAHESHGEFMHIVEVTFSQSVYTVRRMMKAARVLLTADGKPRPMLRAISGSRGSLTKVLELTHLTEEQLDALDAGDDIGGVTLETAPLMTPSDMAAALKVAKEQADADQTLIDQKDEKINKLQRALTKAQRGGVEFEEHAYAETLADVQTRAASYVASARQALAALAALSDTLTAVEVPASVENVIKRDVAMGLCADTFRLGERIAEIILEQQSTFAEFHGGDRGDLDGVLAGTGE